jgi:hypothetical protein
VVKAALPPIAGAVIAVALVVVYRRQNDTERAQFAQRFGSASTQLGDSDTAVRIADVYAMAAAADEGAVFGQLRIRRYLFRRDVSVNPPGGTQPAIPRCITPRPWPPYLVARESGTGSPPAGQDKDDNLDG